MEAALTAEEQHPLLDDIRLIELEAALASFPPPPARVLEIGAGSGWQAALLRIGGYEVAAVDVAVDRRRPRHHTVLPIDGRTLPFADDSFDVVFSSNVLEHVEDLPALLVDVDRVLAPSGRSVHVMPTRTWRVLTILTFYVGAPMRIRRRHHSPHVAVHSVPAGPADNSPQASDSAVPLRDRIAESPHGEFPSVARELLEYGRHRWIERLRAGSGDQSIEAYPAGILYSGYALLPRLSVPMRRRLARAVGSSCLVYVFTRND